MVKHEGGRKMSLDEVNRFRPGLPVAGADDRHLMKENRIKAARLGTHDRWLRDAKEHEHPLVP